MKKIGLSVLLILFVITSFAISYKLKHHFYKNKTNDGYHYIIKALSRSYFARDLQSGNYIPKDSKGVKRIYKIGEAVYSFDRVINSAHTALIVMDPWEDSGSPFLNHYYESIIKNKILPLVNKSIELKIPVYVLTNDSRKASVDYSCAISHWLQSLVDERKITILFHDDFDSKRFADFLRSASITTIIYSGFASNMCLIGRNLGMVAMMSQNFKLYFIPEASAAVEFKDTWKTGEVHRITTLLISQGLAELISLNDFLKLNNPTIATANK